MKRLKYTLSIIAVLSSLAFQTSAEARTEKEVSRDIEKSTSAAVKSYKSGGVSGMTAGVEDCYNSPAKSKFYCVYLDLSSRRIDQIFVESMNYPPSEFFNDQNFSSRAWPVLSNANMSIEKSNEYLQMITPPINKITEKKLFSAIK